MQICSLIIIIIIIIIKTLRDEIAGVASVLSVPLLRAPDESPVFRSDHRRT